jgi:reverse gyrase
MGLYEGIKDVAKVIQKADNIDLYMKLLDLGAQALEMQNEIAQLSAENAELKKAKGLEERIERHTELYITLKNDSAQILYCSHCWDYEHKLIQVRLSGGSFKCPQCKNSAVYNKEKNEESEKKMLKKISI